MQLVSSERGRTRYTDGPPISDAQETEKRVWRRPRIRVAAVPHRRSRKDFFSPYVLVRTKTGQENWARVNCEQQAMETYCPRFQAPGKGKLQPVFPGYLFVIPGDRWRQLRNTYGVLDIVMRDGRPEYVPKDVIKALKRMEGKDGIVTLPEQRTPAVGELVEIKTGAWTGTRGVYIGRNARGRMEIEIEFLTKRIVLEFSRATSIEVTQNRIGVEGQ